MKPKYLSVVIACWVCCIAAKAQTLSTVNVRITDCQAQLTTSKFIVGDVMITVDSRGRVKCDRYFDYTDTHVEHDEINDEDWEFEHAGRIGHTRVTYLDKADSFDNVGKVKSVGDVKINYYDRFDMDNQGKVKSIGDIKLAYYDHFDTDNAGKLKQIGNTEFAYYDHFDGMRKGKVKSIKGITELVNIYYM